MAIPESCPLAGVLAERIRNASAELTQRWLERIAARVSIDPNRIFPTEELLDHVPLLFRGIADYLEDPAEEISTDVPVVGKARELGALRYAQGFDVYEILKEHELLGGIVFAFLTETADEVPDPCTKGELLLCAHRVFRAISIIQQATTTHFLELLSQQVREREERLRGFNRMVSHELKNRVGAILGAGALLDESFLDDAQRKRFVAMVGENAEAIQATLENLVSLSRLERDVRQQRNVVVASAVTEAVRQLREYARSRGVKVEIVTPMPSVEVNAAAVELCLTNYISNAIKYCDPNCADRRVRIDARLEGCESPEGCQLVIEVTDNGLGVPEEAWTHLFQRFYRAPRDTVTGLEGTGLGLSIVRETVESLGGRAWAKPAEGQGSVFGFALPCRREVEHAAEANSGDARTGPPVVAL